MQLSISAPQAWLKYKDANWTPPELWNHGIAGAFLDYNLYASHYAPHQGDNSQNISSYGQAGVNLGAGACVLITSTISHLTMAKAVRPTRFSAYLFVSPNPSNECKTNYRSIRY